MKRALLALVAIAAFVLGGAEPAFAKDCNPKVLRTDATLNPDGTMDVIELLTYDFASGCHGGIRFINSARSHAEDTLGSGNYLIGPITVTENGVPQPIAEARAGFVRWGDANVTVSGIHTYELRYRIVDAVVVAPDVAVLYWQFVGDQFPRMERVDIVIHTPGDGTGLRIFVHGILEGVSALQGRDVVIGVDKNPAGEPIEVRLLEPPGDYTVPPTGEPLEVRILEKEREYAEQANADRQALREQLERDRRNRRIFNIASPFVAGAGLLGFVTIHRKWGKEPEVTGVGDYYREVPEESPAVIQAFVRWGTVPNTAFSATVIDLAQRGYLTIAEEVDEKIGKDKVEYTFTRTDKEAGERTDYESMLLKRMFKGGRKTVTMDELTDEAKGDRTDSADWWQRFAKKVKDDLNGRDFFHEKARFRPYCLHFVLMGALILGGIIMLSVSAWGGLVVLGIAAALFFLTGLLRQRTPKGAQKDAEVEGLRRFLKDFSRVDELPVGGLALYERYLVYGVALGVAKELMEGMKIRIPEIANNPQGFATWYVGSSSWTDGGSRIDGLSNMDSFASSFSSATSAAFSPPSSSSGSGGGFSSGGGGGGGGGGAGGW